jgi:hypothetical protein
MLGKESCTNYTMVLLSQVGVHRLFPGLIAVALDFPTENVSWKNPNVSPCWSASALTLDSLLGTKTVGAT